ncbi:MAG: cellulase family glycosylhydrolase [Ignavibacteria bacterium]|nr:cellulase family glycosylhydrolase [Ignavibacteria bacterium]
MKRIRSFAALGMLLCLSTQLSAQSTAWTRMSAMDKGINLSNWLEARWLGTGYPNPTEYLRGELETLVQMGFRTIRVPVVFEWVTDDKPPYTAITDNAPFAIIDSVIIPVAEKYGLIVILDNHHGRELTDASHLGDIPRLCGMWAFLTEKYRALPHDRFFFELRNEPTLEISNENLHVVQQAIIDTIRAHDADRTLVVGANWWNGGASLAQSLPYRDARDNIIYTFHNYDPFTFTHQGFSWSGIPLGATFAYPSPEAESIFALFSSVRAWSDTHDKPVFLGEFGVSWFADAASRCAYIRCLMDACDSLRFPWLYWDVKHADDAFGIFRGGAVRADSLIPCFRDAMGIAVIPTFVSDIPDAEEMFRVFPNPTAGTVTVSMNAPVSEATCTLFDAMGSGVMTTRLTSQHTAVSVARLPAGWYWLLLEHGGTRNVQALTIRR